MTRYAQIEFDESTTRVGMIVNSHRCKKCNRDYIFVPTDKEDREKWLDENSFEERNKAYCCPFCGIKQ